MASAVAELDGQLTSMLELQPPGVSKAKITNITQLCNANIQSESVLIQKVYTHFKKAPANKKLGVLYVVDSVTRQWLEQARKAGQTLGPAASDGTFAAGVNHVTELLPSLMQDIISAAPDDQKTKILKLVDIWERGNTFPASMVNGFRQKLNTPAANVAQSTTPTGTPPQNVASMPSAAGAAASAPVQNTSAILANLQALANKTSTSNASYPQAALPQNMLSVNPIASLQQAFPGVNAAAPVNNGAFQYGNGALPNFYPPGGQQQQQPPPPNAAGMMPQSNVQGMPDNQQLQQQLQILTALKAQGIPQEQWPALLQVFMSNSSTPTVTATGTLPAPTNVGTGQYDASRNGYDQHVRSPPSRRDRSRSRSPRGWDRRRGESPRGGRRRDSPVYGEYSGNRNSDRDRDYDRGRGGRGRGNGNRQRSPNRRRSPSPQKDTVMKDTVPKNPGPKWIEYDSSLPKGTIKVLSRTLFVGGVTKTNDQELEQVFAAYGRVQTCIVNTDKRHAFIKMITRDEAVRAKEGMETFRHPDMQLRTRWGVGFGPRDCSDYQTGISIIPIDRLTDADRKWMLTAEYGGSGGKQIEDGLCVEEPDIEIGAGVSSKAISRRMQTDKSGMQGPRSTREPPSSSGGGGGFGLSGGSVGGGSSGGGGGRFRDRDGGPPGGISSANAIAVGTRDPRGSQNPDTAPQVPNFNFQFPPMGQPGANGGMPIFPPGLMMPGGPQAPPGA